MIGKKRRSARHDVNRLHKLTTLTTILDASLVVKTITQNKKAASQTLDGGVWRESTNLFLIVFPLPPVATPFNGKGGKGERPCRGTKWISAGLPIPCDWEHRGTAGETRDFFGKWCRATQFGIDYDAWTRAVIIKTPNNKLVESKTCRGWKSFANLSKGRRALKPSSHWHVIYFTNELPRCLYGLLHAKIRLPRSGEDYVAGVVYVLSVRIHDFTSRSVDGWGQERPL